VLHLVWPATLGDFEVHIELLRNPAKSIPAKIDEKSLRSYYNGVISLTLVNPKNL
jgi:hypothetical protein